MTIKDLRELLESCDDEKKILAENSISGRKEDFSSVMGVYPHNGTIIFYTR